MNKITEREKELLKIIQNDPMISQEDLAEMVGITRSATAVHISNLIKKGFILGRGYVLNEKTGVLVIGPVYAEVQASPRQGDEGSARIEIAPGGAGYLIARHLSAQNVRTSIMSVTGRDDWGEIIGQKLRRKNVDTKYMIVQKAYPTPRLINLTEQGINPTRTVSDCRALGQLTRDKLQSMGVTISNCRMLVVDTGIPADTVKYVLNLAREADIPVCLKFSDENIGALGALELNGLSMVVMTGALAERLAKSRIRDLEDGINTAKALNSLGAKVVVVVLPDQGVVLTGPKEPVTVPILPVQEDHGNPRLLSIDVLTAGIVSGILHGHDYRQSIRLGLGMANQWALKSRNLSEWQEK